MTGDSTSLPRLIVITGQRAGTSIAIPLGHCEIGRLPGNTVRLDHHSVSRHHASLTRAGNQITVRDLQSTNGTYVNGRRVDEVSTLRNGDRLRIGMVELRVSWPQEHVPSTDFGFRDVHGPVNAGSGEQYVAGRDQFVAGRDMYGDDHRVIVNSDYDDTDEIFQGRGFGRFLTALGYLIAFTGVGLFGYNLVSIMIAMGPDTSPDLADKKLFGMPIFALGFGAAACGAVLVNIGSGISKAARKRQEEIDYRNRVRRPRRPHGD